MALKAYDLPTVASIVGNFKIRVYSSNTTLTAPTVDTVLEIGDKTETVDAALGLAELGKLTLRVRDDYSVTAYGFWYAALAADECYIRVLLTETTDKFFFVGSVQQDATVWDEHSLYVTPASVQTYIRTASITVIDMLTVALDSSIGDWVTEILANDTDTGTTTDQTPSSVISIKGLFSAILKSSGLNAAYTEANTSIVLDASNPDFVFTIGAAEYDLTDLFVMTEMWRTDLDPDAADICDYFTAGIAAVYLPYFFSKISSILPHILRNFGCALRMDYDSSTETASALGTHKFQLVQRGRAFADASNLVFANAPKESQIEKSFDMLGDAAKALRYYYTANHLGWFSRKHYSTTEQTGTVPDYIDFDIDTTTFFGIESLAGDQSGYTLWVAGSPYAEITGLKYWDYENDTYITTAGTNKMEEAVAGYFFHRFTSVFGKIVRTYSRITASDGSTTSFQHLTILRRTSINDGTGAATYYANRVTQKPTLSETEIEWFKE